MLMCMYESCSSNMESLDGPHQSRLARTIMSVSATNATRHDIALRDFIRLGSCMSRDSASPSATC